MARCAGTKRANAHAIIRDSLGDCRRAPAIEIEAAVAAAGIGCRTYEKARADLGMRWRRCDFQGPIELYGASEPREHTEDAVECSSWTET